jgi:hypothetical protein
MHYLEAAAFLQRTAGLPILYGDFRKVIYVDRVPPAVALRYPSRTGNGDVRTSEYEVVVDSSDATADSVHVLADFTGDDAAALAAVSGANHATHFDRSEFRFTWSGIAPGLHTLTVVAYEPTGNVSVTRFDNIHAAMPAPDTAFDNLPATLNAIEYDDIQIMVDTTDPQGGPDFVFDPAGAGSRHFRLRLTIDGAVYEAQPYAPELIGAENVLYQHDDNLADTFDVFRFNWRGYSTGFHTFEARAELFNTTRTAVTVTRSVQVDNALAGPYFEIAAPVPPAVPGNPPTALLIDPAAVAVSIRQLGPEARSVSAFIQQGESEQLFATTAVDGSVSQLTLTSQAGALTFYNGVATLRVQASTGALGGGIARSASTSVLIVGADDDAPQLNGMVTDGQDNDWTGAPGATIHTATISGLEWIYTGDTADARTDLGDDTNIANLSDAGDYNMDLTELRLRPTADDLFFLVRMREINDPHRVSFALAIDTQTAADPAQLGFIGDQSQVTLDTAGYTWDFSIQVHFPTESTSRVEIYDDQGGLVWYSPAGESSYVSGENGLIEFSIPRSALGLDGAAAQTISLQGATFENQLFDTGGPERLAWNNDFDSTRDIAGSGDALDVVGGEPGVADNAWGRALADGVLDNADPNVVLVYDVTIPSPADSESLPAPAIASVSPADGALFGDDHPVDLTVPVQVETDLLAGAVAVSVNGRMMLATLADESGGTRTWTVTSPTLEGGLNAIAIVAFANANLTGRSDLEQLTWDVQVTSGADGAWMLYR